jgi:predicted PurR-regulated permease PerM
MQDLNSAPWLRRAIVIVLLAGVCVLGVLVLQPFIVSAIWAAALSFSTWSWNVRVTRWCRGNRTLGSLVMTLLLTAAVIVPTASIVWLLSDELGGAYRDVLASLSQQHELPPALLRLPMVGSWLQELNTRIQSDPLALRTALQTLFTNSMGEMRGVLGGVGRNLGKMFITVITLFFFYRDGERFASQVRAVLTQVVGMRSAAYMDAIGKTVKAVLLSLLLCAVSQGVLAGLGYWVAGVPAPIFAAAVTAVAGLIPFAVPVVWVSLVIWLFATSHVVAALGLLVWCATIVSWVDNVVRPLVIGGSTGIPFLLVLFGVLGGLSAFGLVGLFVGPALLAVLLAVWREWRAERTGLTESDA